MTATWIAPPEAAGIPALDHDRDPTDPVDAMDPVERSSAIAVDEALALLDTLEGCAPIGLGYIDQLGRVALLNGAFAAMLGVEAADQIGRPVQEVMPDLWPRLEASFEHALTGQPALDVDVDQRAGDGGLGQSWLVSAHPVSVGGAPAGVSLFALDVTEQKRGSERFRTIVDSMLDALYVLSPVLDDDGQVVDFRIDHSNQAGLILMRGAFADIVGRRLLELAPAATDLAARYRHVLDSGEAFRSEHTYSGSLTHSSQVEVSFEVSAIKVGARLVVSCRDMGPRQAAEDALRRSEERFRSLIQNSTDIILVIAPDATVQYVSPAAERLLGYEPDGMVGTCALDLVHPDDLEQAAAVLASALVEGGIAPPLRYRVRHADGGWRWVESIGNNLLDDPAVSAFVINARDVTEEALVVQDLVATKELLAGITDNMAEGMLAIDRDGAFTFVNAAAERLLGWAESELLGQSSRGTIHCVRLNDPSGRRELCPLESVIQRGTSCRIDREEFVRRDGTTFPVSYSASPLVTDGVSGAVIVFDDITERLAEQSRIDRELEKLAWVGRIRDALDEDRFVLYAQPIVDLASGEVVQHELLLRMLTVDGEVVLPDSFLPTAEEFGLISEIDRWVITETARLAGLGHRVEFNLSTKSVVDPNMVGFIQAALERAGADPSTVVCEITETALLSDAQAGEAFVEGLNAIGCHVALDDFGMGYGGFAYLKRLPVACLKIDREFVRDVHEVPASGHVVSAVVSLAKAFDLQTIAEGAEDLAVLGVLRELGVDFVQGYATGRPAPLDQAFPAEQPRGRRRSGAGRVPR